jgi:hypothetical protein
VNASQFIRIALLLAAIFTAGVFTGRWATPRVPPVVYTVEAPRGSPEAVLARMTAEVGLDEEQQAKARPILEEYVRKMAVTPIGSPERLDHLRQCATQIRQLLRPDQYEKFDQQLNAVTRFFERQVQRNGNRPFPSR